MSPKGKFLEAGEVIGQTFVIEELIGHGGMGCVYRAHDKEQNPVAIKMLLHQDRDEGDWQESAKRLRDEGRALAAVENPALVRVLTWGEDDTYGPYVVLEFLLGDSLRQRLDSSAGKMGWNEVLEKVARPMLQALAALHEAGIVHRDVKPENLFDCGDGTYKLGDLGLASFAGREAHTKTGAFFGTPKYLAPERLNTTDDATAAVDVYSGAMLIVEVMAGCHPFKETSIGDLVKAQLEKKISHQFIAGHGVPAMAARALERALAKEPHERPGAADLLQQLAKPTAGTSSERTSELSAKAVHRRLEAAKAEGTNPLRAHPQLAMFLVFLCSFLLALGYWWSKREVSPLARSLALMSSVAATDFSAANSNEIARLCYSFDEMVQVASKKGLKASELVQRAINESPREGQFRPLLQLLLDQRYRRLEQVRTNGRKLLSAYQKSLPKDESSENRLQVETLLLEQLARTARQGQEFENELVIAANRLEKLVHNHRETYVKQRLRILFIRAMTMKAAEKFLKSNMNQKHKHTSRAFNDLLVALEVAAFHPFFTEVEGAHWQKSVTIWAKECGRTIANLSFPERIDSLVIEAEAAAKRAKDGLQKLRRFVLYNKKLVEAALLGGKLGKRPTIEGSEVERTVSAFRQTYWAAIVAALAPSPALRAIEILADKGPMLHLNHISVGDIERPMREYGWGAGIERGQPWLITSEVISGAFSSLYRERKRELALAESGPLIEAFLAFLRHTRIPSAASIGKKVRRRTRLQLASYPLPEPSYSLLMSAIHLGDKRKNKCLEAALKVLAELEKIRPEGSSMEWRWLSMYHLFTFDILARLREGQKALAHHRHVRKLAKTCEAHGATNIEAIHLEVIGLIFEANVTIRKVTQNDQQDSQWRLKSDEERMERLRAVNPEYPKLIERLKVLRTGFDEFIDELSSEHRTVVSGRPVADVEI